MKTSAILVPGAPVVVPALSGRAGEESEAPVATLVEMLRSAAREAGSVVVWGHDPRARHHGDGRSSLRRWGVDVPVGTASTTSARLPDDPGPDAALLGWWFLDLAGVTLRRSFVGIAEGAMRPPEPDPDTLVVVVADGPASLNPRAPLPEDPRGVALDTRLATWVRSGGPVPDPGASEAAEVGWWSRPAWLALAERTAGAAATESVSWAPFGVGYHGARWAATGRRGAADEAGR